jgi:hypothetical protein
VTGWPAVHRLSLEILQKMNDALRQHIFPTIPDTLDIASLNNAAVAITRSTTAHDGLHRG